MIDYKATKNCELWRLDQPFVSLVPDVEGSLSWRPCTFVKLAFRLMRCFVTTPWQL